MVQSFPVSSIIILSATLLAATPIVSGPGSADFVGRLEAAPPAVDPDLDIDRTARLLEALTPELMRKHGVVGAQVYLTDGRGERALAFGHQDAARTIPVERATVFQATELVRPLTAYLVLGTLRAGSPAVSFPDLIERPFPEVPGFPVRAAADSSAENANVAGAAKFSAYQLLTMSAGFAASRDGLIRGELAAPDADEYLRERLQLHFTPGEALAVAPENFAYAGKYLEHARGESFEKLLRAALADRFGVRDACVRPADCPRPNLLAEGTVHSGKYEFAQTPPHILYPAADSLWISAADYGKILGRLSASAANDPVALSLFRPVLRTSPELGGMAMGFQVLRPTRTAIDPAYPLRINADETQAPDVYVVEGRQPGFASYAFVTREGRGVVVLCNSNERFFIREMVSFLFDRYGLLEKNPPVVLDQAVLKRASELDGSYRARATVPARASWFAFLTDVRVHASGRTIDFGGVFQKEPDVQLVPIGTDLYLARGQVAMDGWRIRVRRDQSGEVVGLDSDLVRYDRVNPFVSAWAILFYLGALTSLPVLGFMLLLVRRRAKTTSEDASV